MPKINIAGKPMYYQDVGEGEVILFGHGYLWDAHMWQPQVQALSQQYRCIVPDLWGHGNSAAMPEGKCSIATLAEHHWQLMQKLGIEQFAVAGLSVGGMWGCHVALSHPESVLALVLMDTFVGPEPEATREKYFEIIDIIATQQKISIVMAEELAPYFFSPITFNEKPAIVKAFKQQLQQIPSEQIATIVKIGRTIFTRQSLLERLPQLALPVMVAVGQDDLPRPMSEARHMKKLIPQGELKVIPKAGHIPSLEQPKVVNKMLASFFAEHLVEALVD